MENVMALDVESETNDDSECQIENTALNAKWKIDMMAPNVELRTNDGSERQTEDVALNTKRKMVIDVELRTNDGFGHQTEVTTLNAKIRIRLWTSKWKRNSERQTEKRHDSSECRTKDKRRLWTPNWRCGSECQNENMTLNVKMKMWLWTSNGKKTWFFLNTKLKMRGDNEEKICPGVARCYNSQSIGRVWKRLHES